MTVKGHYALCFKTCYCEDHLWDGEMDANPSHEECGATEDLKFSRLAKIVESLLLAASCQTKYTDDIFKTLLGD